MNTLTKLRLTLSRILLPNSYQIIHHWDLTVLKFAASLNEIPETKKEP